MKNFNKILNKESIIINIKDIGKDDKSIRLSDPRMIKPYGVLSKIDNEIAFLQNTNTVNFDNLKVTFVPPNNIALSLSIYKKNLISAVKLKRKLSKSSDKKLTLFKENIKLLYDYFEKIQTSIVFIYNAIETFSNHSIPDNYKYEKTNHKGIKEIYSKNEIERWIQTSEKVGNILPDIMKVKSPKNEQFWSDFKKLEKIRNDIIHPKSKKTSALLETLLQKDIVEILNSAVELLNYFISLDTDNLLFPFGFGESKIPIVETENIENMFEKINE